LCGRSGTALTPAIVCFRGLTGHDMGVLRLSRGLPLNECVHGPWNSISFQNRSKKRNKSAKYQYITGPHPFKSAHTGWVSRPSCSSTRLTHPPLHSTPTQRNSSSSPIPPPCPEPQPFSASPPSSQSQHTSPPRTRPSHHPPRPSSPDPPYLAQKTHTPRTAPSHLPPQTCSIPRSTPSPPAFPPVDHSHPGQSSGSPPASPRGSTTSTTPSSPSPASLQARDTAHHHRCPGMWP
jgi:hypothetical protein